MLVARTFDGRTDSALQYLQDSGVPVKLITIVFYEDTSGSRIVDVNNGGDGTVSAPAEAPTQQSPNVPAARTFTFRQRTAVGVTLSDLLEAGLITTDEPIEWRRPQVGDHFRARIDASGAVVVDGGTTYTSLSSAANGLAGGSHNGWECWTVPRLAGIQIGALRSNLPGT